jgi:peptidoglycan/xylan/chitin deacetylase (PgdA/CDA1 family)
MVKKIIFKFIRFIHILFFKKSKYPRNIALYFHNLEVSEFHILLDIINYFKDLDYKICDPSDYGDQNDKNLFLSFDDNYHNWLGIAEILFKNNYKATFYTNTGPFQDRANVKEIKDYYNRIRYFKDNNSLTMSELKKIHSDYNQTIGAHTVFHYNLNQLPFVSASKEILENKNDLELIIGQEVKHFSYPFGMRKYFNEDLRKYCKQIGFDTVSNAIPGQLYKKHDYFDINRTMWDFKKTFNYNLDNIKINGVLFEKITGKSPVG